MTKLADAVPRNFYVEDDYFTLNVRSGIIRSPIGTRMLAVPDDFVAGLHAGLEEETGVAAGAILYQCGRWWGKQFVKRHGVEVRHFYAMDAGELPLHFYQQILRRVWSMYGWGVLDLSFDLRDHGFIDVDVQNAMYSDVVGNIGRTSDFLIAGALASIVGDLAGRDVEAIEVACKSRGDQRCSFLVGVKTRTEVIGQWMKQGRSRSEIHAAIQAGELA